MSLLSRLAALAIIVFSFNSCTDELLPEENYPPVSDETGDRPLTKSSSSSFKFGVAGHALSASPHYLNTPAEEQMKMLKGMGMNIYRFQVMTMSDGRSTVPWRLDPFVKAAKKHGITLLPMIYTRTLDFSVSNSESYQRGKRLGKGFASKYKDIFTYYELGNELDIDCVIPGLPGKSQFSYNQKKFKTIAAYLKGMNHGIKSEDPDAKTMINAGWLRYAYLLMLENHGIDFDIIAYHWYSDMEGPARRDFGIDDIIEKLTQKFDKPIWFTEFNARPKDVADMEKRQDSFLSSFLKRCKDHPQVQAAIVFQLFDTPEKNGYGEQNYGIVKWRDPYSSWRYTLFGQSL